MPAYGSLSAAEDLIHTADRKTHPVAANPLFQLYSQHREFSHRLFDRVPRSTASQQHPTHPAIQWITERVLHCNSQFATPGRNHTVIRTSAFPLAILTPGPQLYCAAPGICSKCQGSWEFSPKISPNTFSPLTNEDSSVFPSQTCLKCLQIHDLQ